MAAKASFKMFQGHHLQSDVVFNQVINTTNKSPPYNLNLNRGFTPGCEITVTGTCKPGVDGFAINLCTNSDIAFHFNPRFKVGVVVRNSKRNGRWETEERDGFLPIHPGQQFILSIVCENDGYKVSINGSYFTYFKHRMSTGLVNKLETTNANFFVTQITYQALLAGKGSPASSGCRIELQHGFSSGSELAITGMAQAYQESCQPGFEFRNKPVIKFGKIGDTPAVRNLLQKRNVVHWGSDDTSTFSIDFESSVPGQSAEKLFTFCPLFREGVVERSSFVGGRWGLKERDGGLPFRMGVTFHLQFKCEPEGFKIYTDGNLFAFFKHRHPNTAITHVNFTGSIVFSKVDYHTQLESIGLNPNEKKWYGEPDMKELDRRQYGQPDFKEGERSLHGGASFYPNLEDSVTKGISQLGRDWESSGNGSNLSRSKSSFDISSEPQKQPRRNRNRQYRRPNRSHTPDPTYTKSLIQIYFPFIQEFDCDWRSSPYKLLLNQGFEPGSEITILGTIPYGSDRFQVNLMQHNGDIKFHFAPRFYEGVIVRNTRIMSTWGVEERDGGLPISIGDQFTINIHSELDGYKVFINNTLFTKFMHRAGGPVAYLDIQDEVSINNIVYKCTMKTHGPNIPLEKGFCFGSEVTLFGQIEPNRDRFSIDLEAPGSITDILFHIEIRWRDGLAVLNSFLNGYWGHEQLERGISLYPGTSVKIRVKCEADGYQVFVNDSYLALYRQGHGAREVRNLAFRGGFKLNMLKYCSKIAYQYPGYQHYQGYEAHQVGIQQDRVFNQFIDTRNETAPYKLNLNCGFNPGSQVTLTGISKPGAGRFHINLLAGSDIALHFNPRFSEQVVVRNTNRNGYWETEERDGHLPFQPGQQYIVTIACEIAGYKVSVNGSPFTLFKHRMNPTLVNELETSDTTSVDQITYQTILAGIGLAISSGFRIQLQYGLSACSEFTITGITQTYHERFSIDFESSLPGQSVNKVLTFSPSFQEGVVERSSFIDNRWGLKEKDGGIPIRVGVMFRLLFRCEPDGFKIYVDGNLFTLFKHRYPALPVTHVCFTGNLMISEMNYHTDIVPISSSLKQSEKQWYGVNSLTKGISELGRDWECSDKISFNFPIIQVFDTTNRSSPYKLPLTQGFEPGSQITIIGSAPYDSDRFHVNLVKANKDIAFHFNPRFHGAVIVRNTLRKNKWEMEERKGGFPFTYDKEFRINIHSEVNSYKVLVNNDFFTTFKHRIGGADTCLEIAEEVRVTNIIYQSIMKSQGPNIPLEKGFSVGSTVEVFGKIDSGGDRFFIDLPSYGYQVDIPLHVQLRWRESLALLNTFTNGIWGHEQIQNGVLLHPETSVRIVIKNESDGFQVFVNKSPLGFYRHRCSVREMKNLTIRGGIQINMIEYCTKI